MTSSYGEAPTAALLMQQAEEWSSGIIADLFAAYRAGQLRQPEFTALSLTVGAATALLASFLVEENAPLSDLRQSELISDTAVEKAWSRLLFLMLHALRQEIEGHEDVRSAVGAAFLELLEGLSAATTLLPNDLEANLRLLHESTEPRQAFTAALDAFHADLVGVSIAQRPLPNTLMPDESDLLTAFPASLYYAHIYIDGWTEFYAELRARLKLPADEGDLRSGNLSTNIH